MQVLKDYLSQERALGRIAADTDTEAVAALLAGAAFQQAFLLNFEGAAGP